MSSDKSMTNEYKRYLEEIHSRIVFPEDLLSQLIKKATGSTILYKEKIVKGEVNQVFEVLTKSKQNFIVRISKQEGQMFLQEKWAMDRCKKLGVPVADILLIEHISIGNDHFSICIINKLEGDTLERGSIDMNGLSEPVLRKIVNQSGEILAKIHSIKTEGVGSIDGKGKGDSENLTVLLMAAVEGKENLLKLAKEKDFDTKIMNEIIDLIGKKAPNFKFIEPKLNHGDYGPKHFMVKDEVITGILDFGEAKSFSPIYDFAWWHYWFSDVSWSRDGKLFEWLKEGYSNKNLFNDDFEEIMMLFQLNLGLGMFNWYSIGGYNEGVQAAKRNLLRDYNFFKRPNN